MDIKIRWYDNDVVVDLMMNIALTPLEVVCQFASVEYAVLLMIWTCAMLNLMLFSYLKLFSS